MSSLCQEDQSGGLGYTEREGAREGEGGLGLGVRDGGGGGGGRDGGGGGKD